MVSGQHAEYLARTRGNTGRDAARIQGVAVDVAVLDRLADDLGMTSAAPLTVIASVRWVRSGHRVGVRVRECRGGDRGDVVGRREGPGRLTGGHRD